MNIETYIEELKELPEPRKTLMEIMKAHKSEVHMANILAYLFKSEEKHGLGKTFIEALLESNSYSFKTTSQDKDKTESNKEKALIKNALNLTSGDELKSFVKSESKEVKDFVNGLSRVHVKAEDTTDNTNQKKKRIDLLLETKECIICIEFKINHVLNNPLDVYQEQIKKMEEDYQKKGNKPRDIFFIVLTSQKKTPEDNVQEFIDTRQGHESRNFFRQVILSHLIKNVVKKIPNEYFIEQYSNPDAQYLTDLIQTIQNREVRFKRSEILKDLLNHVKDKYDSEYFSKGGYGGFIQVKSINSRYKIRLTTNIQIQMECWSKDNIREITYAPLPLSCLNKYETIIQTLSDLIKEK